MIKEEKDFLLDYYNYSNPNIKLSFSTEKGVCYLAGEEIKKGEILLCQKSFYTTPEKGVDCSEEFKRLNERKKQDLSNTEKEIIEKLEHDSTTEESTMLLSMYSEDNKTCNIEERGKQSQEFFNHSKENPDSLIQKIKGIITKNSFSTGRYFIEIKHIASGIWVYPSFINHSCSRNSFYFGIGDFWILVSNRRIKQGEEITTNYVSLEFSITERQNILQSQYNFKCSCEVCYETGRIKESEKRAYAFSVLDACNSIHVVEHFLGLRKLDEIEKIKHMNFINIEKIGEETQKIEIMKDVVEEPIKYYNYIKENKTEFSDREYFFLLYAVFSKYFTIMNLPIHFYLSLYLELFNLLQGNYKNKKQDDLFYECHVLSNILHLSSKVDEKIYNNVKSIITNDYLNKYPFFNQSLEFFCEVFGIKNISKKIIN